MSTEQVTYDLDSPEFSSPEIYDPTQDIDARVPPPELDEQGNVIDYIFKLSIGENKQGEKKPFAKVSANNKPYLALSVKAQAVAEGKTWDKAFVQFPFMGVNTLVGANGTNSMVDLANKLGHTMPSKLSMAEQAAYVMSLLQSEPTIGGRLQWRGYCSGCGKDIKALTGEKNWPEKFDADGNKMGHVSTVECNECGSDIQASTQIKKLVKV